VDGYESLAHIRIVNTFSGKCVGEVDIGYGRHSGDSYYCQSLRGDPLHPHQLIALVMATRPHNRAELVAIDFLRHS
jgi:hypothetical protein